MKHSEAKSFLPIIEAWSEDRTIQFCDDGKWIDVGPESRLDWGLPVDNYRIKPEPQFRAWKPDEVPLGAWMRHKSCPVGMGMIVASTLDGEIRFGAWDTKDTWRVASAQEALESYAYSIDGGRSWEVCGVAL